MDLPGLPVDTHVGRLSIRLGLTTETDPVKVEHAVGELIERRDWTLLSHRVIFHGRRVCHARKPACGVCVLAKDCPSFGEGPTDPIVAARLVKVGVDGRTRAEVMQITDIFRAKIVYVQPASLTIEITGSASFTKMFQMPVTPT